MVPGIAVTSHQIDARISLSDQLQVSALRYAESGQRPRSGRDALTSKMVHANTRSRATRASKKFTRYSPRNNKRKLFNTTTTVLPSWPTTPMVSGMTPSIAQVTSTTTVPSEMTRFCRITARARQLS